MTAQQKIILQCFLMLLANAKSNAHAKMVKQQIKDFEKSCNPYQKTMPDGLINFNQRTNEHTTRQTTDKGKRRCSEEICS